MTPLERIKALGTSQEYGQGGDDCTLSRREAAMWCLCDELLALWEAAMEENGTDEGGLCGCPRPLCKALRDLDAKAAEVLK